MNQGNAANQHTAEGKYRAERIARWNLAAEKPYALNWFSRYYHQQLEKAYKFLVPQGMRVLELGCGFGDLLSSLKPQVGVGVDFSPKMIATARTLHPELRFLEMDVHDFQADEPFDVIILSDLINDLWDVQAVFRRVQRMCAPHTRIVINTYSRLWQIPLITAAELGLAKPSLEQNWFSLEDAQNLLYLSNFEVIRSWQEFLLPIPVPLISSLFNRGLVRIPPFYWFALSNFILARPQLDQRQQNFSVSVIVPARNEQGNIENIYNRVPEMGAGTELVFVEGHSKDDTYQEIERQKEKHKHRTSILTRQPGIGKADAVREGFKAANGDIFMILDADLTVPPEDLPRFYEALVCGKGEFVNGVRLVYPMEKESMRSLNFLGNKFFSLAFSWLLGQPVKDTLCVTKVLWKADYERIAANRAYFGDFDPFGDFDLLFGAAKLGLKIVDLPIRYRERVYGSTNIHRWKHGWLLLKMVLFAAARIKFRD